MELNFDPGDCVMNRSMLLKLSGMVLLGLGIASLGFASAVPEIDAATGMNAVALLTGALLIIRSRKR
jgi:hypothetical protein